MRVAGPFTVESLSPHRVLGVDENDELIDGLKEDGAEYGAKKSFPEMILENLKFAGVQQAPSPTSARRSPSSETCRSCPVRIAPRRSRRSKAALSSVNAFSFARPVPGVIVTISEPTKAMISITAMTSIKVKPDLRSVLHIRDVGPTACSAFMAIGTIRHDLVGSALQG